MKKYIDSNMIDMTGENKEQWEYMEEETGKNLGGRLGASWLEQFSSLKSLVLSYVQVQ